MGARTNFLLLLPWLIIWAAGMLDFAAGGAASRAMATHDHNDDGLRATLGLLPRRLLQDDDDSDDDDDDVSSPPPPPSPAPPLSPSPAPPSPAPSPPVYPPIYYPNATVNFVQDAYSIVTDSMSGVFISQASAQVVLDRSSFSILNSPAYDSLLYAVRYGAGFLTGTAAQSYVTGCCGAAASDPTLDDLLRNMALRAGRYGVQRGGARVATNNPAFVPFTTWLTNTSSGQLVNRQQAQLSNGTNSTNGTAGSADPWVISLEDFVAQRTAGQALTVDLYVVDSEDAAHLDPGVQAALLQFMASGGGVFVVGPNVDDDDDDDDDEENNNDDDEDDDSGSPSQSPALAAVISPRAAPLARSPSPPSLSRSPPPPPSANNDSDDDDDEDDEEEEDDDDDDDDLDDDRRRRRRQLLASPGLGALQAAGTEVLKVQAAGGADQGRARRLQQFDMTYPVNSWTSAAGVTMNSGYSSSFGWTSVTPDTLTNAEFAAQVYVTYLMGRVVLSPYDLQIATNTIAKARVAYPVTSFPNFWYWYGQIAPLGGYIPDITVNSPPPPSPRPPTRTLSFASNYRGCFNDNANYRALPYRLGVNRRMTIQMCAEKAAAGGYTVFGTQATSCYADFNTVRLSQFARVANTGCSSRCPGNGTQFCGLVSSTAIRLSVYNRV